MLDDFTLKKRLGLLFVIAIITTIGVYITYIAYPNAMYQIASSILLAIIVAFWKDLDRRFLVLLISLFWYSMFWSVRDIIMGFYTEETKYENFLALWPTVLALTSYRRKNAEWWQYVISTIVHIIFVIIVTDTDNELLLIMAVLCYSLRRPFVERLIMGSFIWYQAFITVSKYTPTLWKDSDVIYFVALTPYLIALLFTFFNRIKRQ